MTKIIRTPTRAEGGITDAEKKKMVALVEKWKAIAFQTGRCDVAKITDAIQRLYAAAGLKKPRVVVVPSPFVMACAYGLAAGWWALRGVRKRAATIFATDAATLDATRAATLDATYDATDDATDFATLDATRDATDVATIAATDFATRAATYDATGFATYAATDEATDAATLDATRAATLDATGEATLEARTDTWLILLAKLFGGREYKRLLCEINGWFNVCQGGNMWAALPSYAEAVRDVLCLKGLPVWEKYQAWEDAAKYGGFRVMHQEFCLVSDFPEVLKVNSQNRPHCENGPSHRWRDGFEIYHLNGIRVPKWLVMTDAGKIDPQLALTEKNVDVQREIIRKIGAERMLKATNAKVLDVFIDRHTNGGNEYKLMEMEVGQIKRKYLYYEHASLPGVWYAKPVPPETKRAIHARAWILRNELEDLEIMSDEEIMDLLPEVVS